MMPDDIKEKTGKPVSEVLYSKHPAPRTTVYFCHLSTNILNLSTGVKTDRQLKGAAGAGEKDPETICILAKACTDTRKTESNAAYAKRILADKPTTPRSLSSSEKTFKFVQMSDMHSDKDYKVVYS